jgi:hypothetical protein
MIEAFLSTMPLWQKLTAYAFLLIGLFIFVKTGKLKIRGRPLIPMKYRIALALFFPVVFVTAIFFGAIILGVAIAALAILTVLSIFTGKRPRLPKIPKIRINIVRKN